MSADFISKEAVFDARIAQATPSRYAVKKGGAAVTNTPFRSVAATTSQITFTVNVPSQQVFLDRAVELVAAANFRFDVKCTSAQPAYPAVEPVFVFGRDGALCALPIHSMVSTLTVVINDTSVVTDLGTVMRELLRLTDYAANRKIKTAPTYLDLYYNNNDGAGAVNNPNGGFFEAVSSDLLPNGAWFDFVWINPDTGVPLAISATAASYTSNGQIVWYVNGIPIRTTSTAAAAWAVATAYALNDVVSYNSIQWVCIQANTGNAPAVPSAYWSPVATTGAEPTFYPVGIQFRTAEFLMCSPLIFADSHEESTGLFGLNNLQAILNLKSDVSRTIRSVESYNRLIGRGGIVAPYNFGSLPGLVASKPFDSAVLNCMMISPSLDIPLPSVSMVPWAEYPRYISTGETMGAGVASATISTNSLTVPVVPDLLVIYAKPQENPSLTQADYYLPIDQISLNFDNTAGLMSTMSPFELFRMSCRSGLDMSYDQWRGFSVNPVTGARLPLTGGFLVISPGYDFALGTGIASGLQGNFVIQATVRVNKPDPSVAVVPQVYIMTINSGYFSTLAGSSRILRNLLNEADILGAKPAPEGDRAALKRMVGAGFLSSLGSVLSKAKSYYDASKPLISAVKGDLPEGMVKNALGAVGYGKAGAGGAGAGRAGAGKSLASRLM